MVILTGTDLFHLDSDFECLGENLDQRTKIDTFVGNIVEDSLRSVTLILDIADFHVQIERIGDAARFDHGVVLAGACLLIFFNIGRLGLSENTTYFSIGFHVGLPHLKADERTGQSDLADVMTRIGFNSHHVADFERYVERIFVESFSRIFELDLDHVVVGITARDILKPVVTMEFSARKSNPLATTLRLASAFALFLPRIVFV